MSTKLTPQEEQALQADRAKLRQGERPASRPAPPESRTQIERDIAALEVIPDRPPRRTP